MNRMQSPWNAIQNVGSYRILLPYFNWEKIRTTKFGPIIWFRTRSFSGKSFRLLTVEMSAGKMLFYAFLSPPETEMGVSINGGIQKWLVNGKYNLNIFNWMITGCTPISGNHQMVNMISTCSFLNRFRSFEWWSTLTHTWKCSSKWNFITIYIYISCIMYHIYIEL